MRCGVIAPASCLRQAGPSLEEGIVRLFDILPFLDRRGQGWLTSSQSFSKRPTTFSAEFELVTSVLIHLGKQLFPIYQVVVVISRVGGLPRPLKLLKPSDLLFGPLPVAGRPLLEGGDCDDA